MREGHQPCPPALSCPRLGSTPAAPRWAVSRWGQVPLAPGCSTGGTCAPGHRWSRSAGTASCPTRPALIPPQPTGRACPALGSEPRGCPSRGEGRCHPHTVGGEVWAPPPGLEISGGRHKPILNGSRGDRARLRWPQPWGRGEELCLLHPLPPAQRLHPESRLWSSREGKPPSWGPCGHHGGGAGISCPSHPTIATPRAGTHLSGATRTRQYHLEIKVSIGVFN